MKWELPNKKKKEKIVIEIPYDPRKYPVVEIWMYPPGAELEDPVKAKANFMIRSIKTQIYNILRMVGLDPEMCIKTKYITADSPVIIPSIYINDVLFSTVYLFDSKKFYDVMKQIAEIRKRYYNELYKRADEGFLIIPNEHFIHTRDPIFMNKIISALDYWRYSSGTFALSMDTHEMIHANTFLIDELEKLGVPTTPIGAAREVKYAVFYTPEEKVVTK